MSIDTIVNLFAWAFFSILIYRETQEVQSIFEAFGMYYIGVYISFVVVTFLLDRIGYLGAYRLSMLAKSLCAFLIFLITFDFESYFLIASLFYGLSAGAIWPVFNSYLVKDVVGDERTALIGSVTSISLLLRVFIPTGAGAIISFTNGYEVTFLIATAIYFLAMLYPFKSNLKTDSKISSAEVSSIIGSKFFTPFFAITFFRSLFTTAITVSMTLVPFLFLESEFNVGVLASVSAFIAAIMAFADKKASEKSREELGAFGWILYAISNLIFVFIWTAPVLIFRSLTLPFTIALGDTSRQDLDVNIREKILGKNLKESAREMNLVVETIFLFARLSSLGIIIFLLEIFSSNQEGVVRAAIGAGVVFIGFLYFALIKLFNSTKKVFPI